MLTFRSACGPKDHRGTVSGQLTIDFFSRHNRPLAYVPISLAVTAGIGALVQFEWYRPMKQRDVSKARQYSGH